MDEMAKHKNRRDLMEEIEDPFLDDPEAETAEEEPDEAAIREDETGALRAEVADLKDRLLRALADVENIRKRAERDRRDAELYGATRFARDLLNAFEKHRIVKIAPKAGERFDPKLHQAMFEAPVPGTKAGDIIQVMGVGFTIGDRLLRPAQVGVSSGGPAVPGSA